MLYTQLVAQTDMRMTFTIGKIYTENTSSNPGVFKKAFAVYTPVQESVALSQELVDGRAAALVSALLGPFSVLKLIRLKISQWFSCTRTFVSCR